MGGFLVSGPSERSCVKLKNCFYEFPLFLACRVKIFSFGFILLYTGAVKLRVIGCPFRRLLFPAEYFLAFMPANVGRFWKKLGIYLRYRILEKLLFWGWFLRLQAFGKALRQVGKLFLRISLF
jgi:hypothetical protein